MTTAPPDSRPALPPPRVGWPLGTIVKAAVILLLFGGVAVALQGGWERLREYRWHFEPWSVGMSLGVMIVASVWAAFAWIAVLRALHAPLAARPALRIYATSNLGKYLPGKVLHAFARVYLAQQEGVPLTLATATVLIDVVLTVASAGLMMVLAFPTIVSALTDLDGPLVTAVAAVGVVTCLALLHPVALNFGFALGRRLMPGRTFPAVETSYFTLLKIFVLYVVVWALYTVALFGSIQAVHPISATTLLPLSAIYTFSYLSGLVMPLAPAGLGVREGLLTLLLSQLIPVPAAAAAAVLVRVLQVAAEALCAAVLSRL